MMNNDIRHFVITRSFHGNITISANEPHSMPKAIKFFKAWFKREHPTEHAPVLISIYQKQSFPSSAVYIIHFSKTYTYEHTSPAVISLDKNGDPL